MNIPCQLLDSYENRFINWHGYLILLSLQKIILT